MAEPVRRIAQPLTVPPGVDYHRLSADEHAFICQELIVPMYLGGIIATSSGHAVCDGSAGRRQDAYGAPDAPP